jgi:hypothetical protein
MNLTASLMVAGLLAGLHFSSDAPQLNGVHLEMPKARVHRMLNQVADLKSQDENQEVWIFRNDSSIRSLIVGYAPDNQVRYVTELPKARGKALSCKPLGDIKHAQMAGTEENAVYTRSWKEHEDEFVVIARAEAGHLTSCSVKKVGVGIESEDEDGSGKHI